MKRLEKYNNKGSFFFHPLDKRRECFKDCKAPSDVSGIYLIYGINQEYEHLVYIGTSGLEKDGIFQHRKDGIMGRLKKGTQTFPDGRKKPRYIFFKEMMLKDGYERLRIDWYVTFDDINFFDNPLPLEHDLTKKYNPTWDRKIKKK